MNVYQAFPSRFLSGGELRGPTPVTIATVKEEQLSLPGVGEVTKWVMYVEHGSKGVVLNRTLAIQIAAAVGEPYMEKWAGKKVVLYGVPMTVAGVPRMAIRAKEAE